MNEPTLPRPLTIGILGYSTRLSFRGLHSLAEDNSEQVEIIAKDFLILKDGTRIIPIAHAEFRRLYGLKLDQLILFDDDRQEIYSHCWELISELKKHCLIRSCVPKELQIIWYEDYV